MSKTKKDYYEVLGVSKSADEVAMKAAYRKLAMQYHPDKNPGDKSAEDKFKEAAEAYEILSNPDKKAKYDRFGHAAVDGSMGGGGTQGGFNNVDDIFGAFQDIFGESFFNGGSQGGRQGGGVARGTNLRIRVKLTIEEIGTGVTKKIKVRKQLACNTCHGSGAKDANSVSICTTCKGSGYVRQVRNTFLGQMATTAPCVTCKGSGRMVTASCSTCKGEGTVSGEEMIEISIPAGVSDGMQLQMSGKGNAAPKGGAPGDLIISIEEIPHEHFHREGMNIHYEAFLNFADAALGTSIEVPTIDGRVRLKIPQGTQAGKVLRLEGKGLPSVQSYGKGDQLVHLNIWTPKKVNDEEKLLLEKLRVMPNLQPKPEKDDKGFFDRLKDIFR